MSEIYSLQRRTDARGIADVTRIYLINITVLQPTQRRTSRIVSHIEYIIPSDKYYRFIVLV